MSERGPDVAAWTFANVIAAFVEMITPALAAHPTNV
jgi:hypothetical protein